MSHNYKRGSEGTQMYRKLGLFLVALATAFFGFTAIMPAANAANPHWITDPYCSANNQLAGLPGFYDSLSCSGKAAGLGSGPIFVVVTADGGCTNQDGTHVIPGKSTTSSGPLYPSGNGQFTFGAENNQGENQVTPTGPTGCKGKSQNSFITTNNVFVTLYQCTSGEPRFNKKGEQTNSNCVSVLGPTPATIV